MRHSQPVRLSGLLCILAASAALGADEPANKQPVKPVEIAAAAAAEDNKALVKLSKTEDVWIDNDRKAVVTAGEVSLREGQLEMFACPAKTKEHESVVTVNSSAATVHAALLAIGAEKGKTVKFDPKYEPAEGQIVDVFVFWKDEKGMPRATRGQDWVKNAKTGKPLAFDWVFAGSGFWEDEKTGKKHYMANSGDLICVSNFPTATLDLPVESSQANDSLTYVAFTERIPPRGTKVRMVLLPRAKAKVKSEPKKAEGKAPADQGK